MFPCVSQTLVLCRLYNCDLIVLMSFCGSSNQQLVLFVYVHPHMNIAGFEACIRAPSPASTSFTMPPFGAPVHGLVQNTQLFPASSSHEFRDGSSVYSGSNLYSVESSGSRTVCKTALATGIELN